MTNNGKILVACLADTDFELWVDPDEWAGLDLSTQTARKLYAHSAWFRQKHVSDSRSEQERLTEKIQDERLKSLVWRAWLALPNWERDVLNALGFKFEQTTIPDGILGRCWSNTNIAEGISPFPIIMLDPAKYSEDDDRTLRVIFHEVAHACYRHKDILECFKGEPHAELLDKLENHAWILSNQWLKLEKKRREKSHSHNGAAAQTAAQNEL